MFLALSPEGRPTLTRELSKTCFAPYNQIQVWLSIPHHKLIPSPPSIVLEREGDLAMDSALDSMALLHIVDMYRHPTDGTGSFGRTRSWRNDAQFIFLTLYSIVPFLVLFQWKPVAVWGWDRWSQHHLWGQCILRPKSWESRTLCGEKKCFPPAVTLLSSLAGHFFKSQIEALVSLFQMDRSTRRSVYFVYTIVVLTIDMFMSIWTFSALECKSMECAVQQNETLSLLELLTHLSYPFLVQNETSTLFKEALCEPYEFFVFQNIKNI